MKKILILCLVLVLVVGCVSIEKKCSSDDDCVKATCCHASDSVNEAHAPDCKGILCTMECVPKTTDCGQGKIECVEGSCEAVLNV